MAKKICLPKSELVKEHKHLVKVLKGSKRKVARKEGRKQSKELKEYRRK